MQMLFSKRELFPEKSNNKNPPLVERIFLFDILVEAFFEIFSEGFIALCSAFIPQKVASKKRKKIIGYVCLAISLILLVGLFAGIIILVETKGQSFWGWLLISLNIIYLLAGITLKIISHIKK